MNTYSHFAAANAASANRFLQSVNMKVGAYTLDETTRGIDGAGQVTLTHTAGDTVDTLGTVTIVGTDLSGQTITEVLTPSSGATVTSSKWFKTVTSATGAGWVIDGVESTEDTITIGYTDAIRVLDGPGRLESIIVNTTAASAIVVADASGTIATLKASIGEGHYVYDLDVTDLTIDLAGNSDITIIHTPSIPKSYALA